MMMIHGRMPTLRMLIFCTLMLPLALAPFGQTAAEPTAEGQASWLEPRGINVVDLVGLVPEEHLVDIIMTYVPGLGIVQYVEGSRVRDSVHVKVSYQFSDTNKLRCLGRTGYLDNWPTVSPGGLMRVFDGEQEITDRVETSYVYYPAGQVQPYYDALSQSRYEAVEASIVRDASGAIVIPANMGCRMEIAGDAPTQLTAEFTFTDNEPYVAMEPLFADTVMLHSYIGTGAAGILDSLRDQMIDRFGSQLPPHGRHEGWQRYPQPDDVKRMLSREANYVLVKFPPMPIDEFGGDDGWDTPSGGTYRLFFSDGVSYAHSVDHLNAHMLPLHWNFQDADQAPSSTFLPTFSTFEQIEGYRFDEVKGPEYFLPPGVDYHPCMSDGGCSDALLDEVFNTTYPMEVYFYRVERIRGGLEQIPLRMAGPKFTRSERSSVAPVSRANMKHHIFVPSVYSVPAPPLPDNPSACEPYGCGWFDDVGRMWSLVTPP